MTDRRISQDCCLLPAVIRMCQTASPDLPCYSMFPITLDITYDIINDITKHMTNSPRRLAM
ncbi:UNVERIFIED_CONTAM: hypothetical protein FKN15_056477 [Acipenser sinensis]